MYYIYRYNPNDEDEESHICTPYQPLRNRLENREVTLVPGQKPQLKKI